MKFQKLKIISILKDQSHGIFALQLAERNHVKLPYTTEEEMGKWAAKMIADDGLNGFMLCDRTFNSVCLHEQDYEDVVLALAKMTQNRILFIRNCI